MNCRRSLCNCITYAAAVLATLLAIGICVIIATELEDVEVNTTSLQIFGKNADVNETNANAIESLLTFFNLTSPTGDEKPFVTEAECLLGKDRHNASLCIYMYWVVGISLIASLALSLIQCITCNLCGMGQYLDLILSVAGTLWWAIAAVVTTQGAVQANDNSVPQEQYRNAVVGMVWAETAMFGLIVASGVVFCTGRCAGGYYEKV